MTIFKRRFTVYLKRENNMHRVILREIAKCHMLVTMCCAIQYFGDKKL